MTAQGKREGREKLTPAQKRHLQRAAENQFGRAILSDGRRGFRTANWRRLMERLCRMGLMKPYPHGDEYEITDAGRAALTGGQS